MVFLPGVNQGHHISNGRGFYFFENEVLALVIAKFPTINSDVIGFDDTGSIECNLSAGVDLGTTHIAVRNQPIGLKIS